MNLIERGLAKIIRLKFLIITVAIRKWSLPRHGQHGNTPHSRMAAELSARQMEISLLLAATLQLNFELLCCSLMSLSLLIKNKNKTQQVCVCKLKKWIKSFNWYWYKETRWLNDESHYVFPFNHRIIWIWSLKKCFQHSSLDSVPVNFIHFPTGGCINLPPHSFHWYSFKWVSSLPPHKYAWELLSFGIEWAWSLCDSLCSCAWNIGIGKCYAICVPVSEVCVCLCTEGLWDQVLRSIAAAGKLKCHYWFPAALGAKAVCGWLSDNLAWLMRVRSRAHAAEMSRRSNTCSRAAQKTKYEQICAKNSF